MNGENPTSLQQIVALAKSESVKECTYSKGYIDQVVFACLTCYKEQQQIIPESRKKELIEKYGEATDPAALCIACSLNCHENHDIFLLHRKGGVRCDCGNSKFLNQCKLCPEKDYDNDQNIYDHNYFNRFCHCNQEYDDDSEAMLQCEICFDWFHISHACLADDQYVAVKHQTKKEDKEDSAKSSTQINNIYIDIERAVYICKKCLHSKYQFFIKYLALWRFLAAKELTIDDLTSRNNQILKRAKPDSQNGEVIEGKEQKMCIFDRLKAQTIRPPKTQGKKTAYVREEEINNMIVVKEEEEKEPPTQERKQCEERKVKSEKQEESKEKQKNQKNEQTAEAMLVSLESQDYCKCNKCWLQLEPIVEQLQKKQQIGGKCLLEFEPSQVEIPTPLLPVVDQKVTQESLQLQVAELFNEITHNFENRNQNVPHNIKIFAAEQFKKFFDKFKTFLQAKEDSVVTEKDVRRFCEQIKSEETPWGKPRNQEEDSDVGGNKRKQQEGQ